MMRKLLAAGLALCVMTVSLLAPAYAAQAADFENIVYVVEEDGTLRQSQEPVRYGRIATEKGTLNMRAEAKDSAKILEKLAKGTLVQIVQDLEGWTEIRYKDRTGYVMTKFLAEITELPYAAVTKEDQGDAVLAVKRLLYSLDYIKSDEINTRYDQTLETALTKLQLMNGVPLSLDVVTPELQALIEWGMIAKYKSGYLGTQTDPDTGLSAAIFCWDTDGTLYDDDQAVKLKIAYAVQAAGGQAPYTITVRKSLSATDGENHGDIVKNPISHIWNASTDTIYIYATVVDAAGNTVTAVTNYRYVLPSRYTEN